MSSSITKFWKNWSVWFGRVGGKNVKCDPQQRLFYDKSGKYHRTSTKLIIYRKVHFIRKFISAAAAYQSCHNCCGYLDKTNDLSKIIYYWWYDAEIYSSFTSVYFPSYSKNSLETSISTKQTFIVLFRCTNVVDNMVQLLEKNMMDLEKIVLERSVDLRMEKSKTEFLLLKMLPR